MFGAFAAGFGAFCAVFHVCCMFFTLICAGCANFCTDTAKFFGAAAAEAHELGGAVANGGAFHIELDALCHHFYVFLLQAGGCAMVTDGGTTQACVYALLKFVVAHSFCILFVDE